MNRSETGGRASNRAVPRWPRQPRVRRRDRRRRRHGSDLFLAQNHDHREPETGVWRGGVGQLLRGLGEGRYEPVPPLESGILLRGDATGVEAIDLDLDGDLDLVATQNDDAVAVFLNRSAARAR